jgi:RimJ/RimL family protein N-acetyltransferase
VALSLRTSRLLLRPWRDEDLAAFAEMSADPIVMEYLLPLSRRGLSAEAWVARARAHWDEHGFGQWVVELLDAGNFIGVVGLGVVSYEAASSRPWKSPGDSYDAIGIEATRARRPGPRSVTASVSLV